MSVHFHMVFRAVSGKEEALGMVVARLHLDLISCLKLWQDPSEPEQMKGSADFFPYSIVHATGT